MKKFGLMVMGLALMVVAAVAQESKYSTSSTGTDPAVTFSPKNGRQIVKAVSASVDVANGVVKFYTRVKKYAVTSTNSATEIVFANTANAVNTNDIVVYVHANGTVEKDTVASGVSTTGVTLTTGITSAWASGDYLYEVSQSGQIVVGLSTTAAGTNAILNDSGDLFVVPGDSPLYVTSDCATNGMLQVTVE